METYRQEPQRSGEAGPELSIVVPVLNEEGSIEELYRRLTAVLEQCVDNSFEVIFVDDGSSDRSWEILKHLHAEDDRVKGLKLSRNFGHQYALKAGLDSAVGEAVISIDCDLQHPPELIEEIYRHWKEGYDVVNTVKRSTKGQSLIKSSITKLGYGVINTIANVKIEPGSADFRLLDRKVVNEFKGLREGQLLLRGIVSWMGYRSISLEYVADDRFAGVAKYSFAKLAGLVLSGVMSFSPAPLRVFIYLGFLTALAGFVYGIYVFVIWLIVGSTVPGWTTTTLLLLWIGGTILLVVAIIGEYVARIYEEIKQRPDYIIVERVE